jgi:hypothetical protein
MRRSRAVVPRLIAGIVLLAGAGLASCGGDDLTVGTGLPVALPTARATARPTCGQVGDACTFDSDCCDGNCAGQECV